LPVGVLIKLLGKNVKLVYDCHEYETEINGLRGIEKAAKKWLERFLISHADQVITVSKSIAAEYERLYHIPKPQLVLNCPLYKEQRKFNFFREKFGIRADQTIFLYQGGLSEGRGIELILKAFSGLDVDKSVLIFMGYGPLEQYIQQRAQNSDTIFFHPAVGPDVLLDFTSSADYGIIFYEDNCLNHSYCSPNKVFEYLMAGLPVLTSKLYELNRLVCTEGVGIVAEENSVAGFQKAVTKSLGQDYKEIQENVFKARKKYCWENQEAILKEVYDAL
jgi:glycosyltransferase involved in cell wall biosynthesis